MHFKAGLMLSTLLLTACGGGGGGSTSTPTPTPPVNQAPNIDATIVVNDSSGDGIIKHEEEFTVLLKITDPENNNISGSMTLDGIQTPITSYSGSEDFTHQAVLQGPELGEYTINISATDGTNTDTTNTAVEIFPNSDDVSDLIGAEKTDYTKGGSFEGEDLLGVSLNSQNSNIGYVETELSDVFLEQNGAPSGECGARVPHKIVRVSSTSSGITIPEDGLVFPLECVTNVQSAKIMEKAKSIVKKSNATDVFRKGESYVAQTITLTVDTTEDGEVVSTNYTGSGIGLEGNIQNVFCGSYELDIMNGDTALLNAERLLENPTAFDANDELALNCRSSVLFNGLAETSDLLGEVHAKIERLDSLAPTGAIDTVVFSVPFNDGALDVGNVCVVTTAMDETGDVSEVVSLVSSDGLSEPVIFPEKNSNGESCLALDRIEGDFHVEQLITDESDNQRTNMSATFPVFLNQAPVFSAEVPETLIVKQNTGTITLVTEAQVSDPETHTFELSGDTLFDTTQPVGNYSSGVTATDQYGALTTKEILVSLVDNFAPVASPIADAGQNMAADNGSTITLDGSNSSDPDGDTLSYAWTLESKPTGSRSVLTGLTTSQPSLRVDRQGSYEVSLVVNDGKLSSEPSSIIIDVIGVINPLSDNVDVVVTNVNTAYGFSGVSYDAVLQSSSSSCGMSSMDLDENGIVWALRSTGQSLLTFDPEQPDCEAKGNLPERMFGLAYDTDGTLWGTTNLKSEEGQTFNTLVNFNKSGEVIREVRMDNRQVVYGIDFAPDGELYGIKILGNKELVRINSATGEVTKIADLPVEQLYDIDISGDNILRLYDQNARLKELKEFDLDGSPRQTIILDALCTSCGFVGVVGRE